MYTSPKIVENLKAQKQSKKFIKPWPTLIAMSTKDDSLYDENNSLITTSTVLEGIRPTKSHDNLNHSVALTVKVQMFR